MSEEEGEEDSVLESEFTISLEKCNVETIGVIGVGIGEIEEESKEEIELWDVSEVGESESESGCESDVRECVVRD